jgi:hypothetical protein
MKKGKTFKLELFKDAKCYFGSVNTTELKSIYLVLQTWVTPKVEKENWNVTVGSITRTIKHKILEISNKNLFKDHFIVDMDLRTSGIRLKKSSFLNLEITFFTKQDVDFKSNEISEELTKIISKIYHEVLADSKYFTIQYAKTKEKMKV